MQKEKKIITNDMLYLHSHILQNAANIIKFYSFFFQFDFNFVCIIL